MAASDGGYSQADQRRAQRMRDQHGREWFANVEKRSGHPTGLISLTHRTPKGAPPPWVPDQGYLLMDEENPTRLTIDYRRMLDERLKAHEEYHQRAVEEAAARQWPVPAKGEAYDYKLAMIVGRPPKPWQPIVAAMGSAKDNYKGNSWILGFTDTVDERLLPYVRRATAEERLLEGLPDFSDLSDEGEGDEDAGAAATPRRTGRKRDENGRYATAGG